MNWFIKLFTTTDYIFDTGTTWLYMLIVSVVSLVIIVKILNIREKSDLDEGEKYVISLFTFIAIFCLVNGIGILFYLMAFLKTLWKFA